MAITATAASGHHFDPAKFDAFLARHGTPVTWFRRSACPCAGRLTTPTGVINEGDGGQPDPNCVLCRDSIPGSIYDDGAPLVVLGPGRMERDQYVEAGRILAGAVTFTFASTVTPGHLDRVVLNAGRMVVNNEQHLRGELSADGQTLERLKCPDILSVDGVTAIVAGARVFYEFFAHFTVDDHRNIIWNDHDGPPVGAQYSVRYQSRPQYLVWDPQSRDEAGVGQPYKAVAQRLDWFYRSAEGA